MVGLVVMVLMMFFCMRRMGAMCGCGGHHERGSSSEVEALRREVQSLRDELRTGRDRA